MHKMEQAKIDLWVIDAKLKDEKAFEQLFKHFQPAVLRYAYKMKPDQQLAQEATQNSWIKIAKTISRLNDHRAFKSWLFQSVHWQMLDLIRKQKFDKQCVSIDEVDELPNTKKVTEHENTDIVFKALSSLEDIDKQAIHLFYLEEMSVQEISIVLSIPQGTVKSRLNRARNSLKKKVGC